MTKNQTWVCDRCNLHSSIIKGWRFANALPSKANGKEKPWALCSAKCEALTNFGISKSHKSKGTLRAILMTVRLSISFTPKLWIGLDLEKGLGKENDPVN